MTENTKTAVLLIAHGSRRAEANAELVRLAELVRETGRYPIVETAYLEVTQPTIPEGAKVCIERGAASVRMMPYFLSPGVHAINDLEEFRSRFEQEYPGVEFSVCQPLGLHPKLVDVVLARLEEVD
ncbi:MAG TPA: CbiX/SirB N-terminal domain-containing protein [Planctomycetaceae bacterium]|nr:CbiX/SirB N-terminal domain-containing protein [Planctomycetaceae bacterium]